MFEFGRELRRLFSADAVRDGFTGGDASLLELLELDLLRAEGRAADVAAGRVGAKDRPRRQLEAARVWREIARRTGDAIALRKGAAQAEQAAAGFRREARTAGWATARTEQAMSALLGAALFGDEGLNAAADVALAESEREAGPCGAAIAAAGRALVEARALARLGARQQIMSAAGRFEAPIRVLDGVGRRRPLAVLLAAQVRIDRAGVLLAAGQRLKDPLLLRMAADAMKAAVRRLDPAYEPLTWARAEILRQESLSTLAELDGDIEKLAEAVNGLAAVFDHLGRDHSPLDWAAANRALGEALVRLAETTEGARAFDQAAGCFGRALTVMERHRNLAARAEIAHAKALSVARRAEMEGDLKGLAAAEADLRAELAREPAGRDPLAWAVRQLALASIYEARVTITARDRGERESAGAALAVALEVFGEHGQRGLADVAARALERVRESWPASSTPAQPRRGGR
jgi:hypothetical protein